MSELTVGNIIEGPAARDAIHIAIAPVVAGEELEPGLHVGLDENGLAVSFKSKSIGVVDPFLKYPVEKGQKFYLFLYPKTVTGLRHEWSHPSFRTEPTNTSVSMGWLQHFAEMHQMTYNDMMVAVDDYVAKGCQWATIEDDFKQRDTPDEFWVHYKAVSGRDGTGNIFGCCV